MALFGLLLRMTYEIAIAFMRGQPHRYASDYAYEAHYDIFMAGGAQERHINSMGLDKASELSISWWETHWLSAI